MRNTVAKQLRRLATRYNRNKAWYRTLKREWHKIPPKHRHAVMQKWLGMKGTHQ